MRIIAKAYICFNKLINLFCSRALGRVSWQGGKENKVSAGVFSSRFRINYRQPGILEMHASRFLISWKGGPEGVYRGYTGGP